jgi:hypothetical protein
VVERQTPGGIAVFRFGLDPVAEYLAAIQSVNDLRELELAKVTAFLNALMNSRVLSCGDRMFGRGGREETFKIWRTIAAMRQAPAGLPH